MNAAQRAALAQQMEAARMQITQVQQGGANWRALVGAGLEQTDDSGNPIMPAGGGATINIYSGQAGAATPPSGGGVQPPPIANGAVQAPPVTNGAVQPPPAVQKMFQGKDGKLHPFNLINGQWVPAGP
jgi:hypothetical protein